VSEAASWRLDTLPLNQKDWIISNPDQPEAHQLVKVNLEFGTKGPDLVVGEHGDKIGKPELIKVPLAVARRIHAYRENVRPLALNAALRKAKTAAQSKEILAQSVHLFINPADGMRYNVAKIQYFWKMAKGTHCPYKWSPHAGRHYWACNALETKMQSHAFLMASILKLPGNSSQHPLMFALKDTAMTVVTMEIQPQLRHSGPDTTAIYLRWLFERIGVAVDFSTRWLQDDGEQTRVGA